MPPSSSKAIGKPRRSAGQTSRRRAFIEACKRARTDEHGLIDIDDVDMPVRPPPLAAAETKALAKQTGGMRTSKTFLDALAVGTEVRLVPRRVIN